MASKKVTVLNHPMMQETLTRLRDKRTPPEEFRRLMENAGVYLGLKALEDQNTRPRRVWTPLRAAPGRALERPIVLAAILRAGLGLVPGLSRILPEAHIGHIGLYRNEETLNPVQYMLKLPLGLARSYVLLLDPMLATGGSAAEAVRILKAQGARHLSLVTLLATRPGIRRVHKDHPEVPIITAAIDPVLNKIGYIVPGLGDAGDRLFNTGARPGVLKPQ